MMELKRESFLTQYPLLSVMDKKDISSIWEKEFFHLYVHIPFCARKCDFCYYKSFVLKNASFVEEYFENLKEEIKLYSKMPQVQSKQIRSIYFGGGTPTILSETQISSIMDLVTKSFDIHNECEICFEVRPGKELTKEKLILLKELGVNRISIGCQSTDDNVLKINGRNLVNQEFLNSYHDITDVGFTVKNVDIMSGMVNQSFESWDNTIQDMIKLDPENIAIYKLEIYLNNQLYKRFRNGEISIISDDEEIRYFHHGINQFLSAGYIMADNFTFVKDMSLDHIHRRRTWLGEDMLGVGLSAHSCFNDIIFQNEPSMQEYNQKIRLGALPIFRAHVSTTNEIIRQRIIFGIKNLHFSRKLFYDEFGIDCVEVFQDEFKHLESMNFIKIFDDYIETTLEGIIFADDIVRSFFLPEHQDKMLAHISRDNISRTGNLDFIKQNI